MPILPARERRHNRASPDLRALLPVFQHRSVQDRQDASAEIHDRGALHALHPIRGAVLVDG
jgi:hypothetical protein